MLKGNSVMIDSSNVRFRSSIWVLNYQNKLETVEYKKLICVFHTRAIRFSELQLNSCFRLLCSIPKNSSYNWQMKPFHIKLAKHIHSAVVTTKQHSIHSFCSKTYIFIGIRSTSISIWFAEHLNLLYCGSVRFSFYISSNSCWKICTKTNDNGNW